MRRPSSLKNKNKHTRLNFDFLIIDHKSGYGLLGSSELRPRVEKKKRKKKFSDLVLGLLCVPFVYLQRVFSRTELGHAHVSGVAKVATCKRDTTATRANHNRIPTLRFAVARLPQVFLWFYTSNERIVTLETVKEERLSITLFNVDHDSEDRNHDPGSGS